MGDFNYLITVHNKEFLLERVLEGVALTASASARIVVVRGLKQGLINGLFQSGIPVT